MIFHILSAITVLCAFGPWGTFGQRIPQVNISDTTLFPFRQNWCKLRNTFMNDTLNNPWTILRGQIVYFGTDMNINDNIGDGVFLFSNLTTGAPISGQTVDVLNELSARMGFKIQWVSLTGLPIPPILNQYLSHAVKVVDIYASDMFWDTATRRSLNAERLPPLGIDAIELVALGNKVDLGLQLWQFGVPFSGTLWILSIFIFIFNGLLLWLFRPPYRADENVFYFLYRSVNAFAGEKIEDDHNLPSMIATIGYNFLLLVLLSSYVANLAAVLISSSSSTTLSVNSFQEASDKGLTICIQTGSAPVALVRAVYPDLKMLELKNPYFVLGPNAGLCAGYASGTSNVLGNLVSAETNPQCNLVRTNSIAAYAPYAHSYYGADFDSRCTRFLGDILSIGMQQLIVEDFPALSMQRQLSAFSTVSCPTAGPDSLSIPVSKLVGIFVLYLIAVVVAVIIFYSSKLYLRNKETPAIQLIERLTRRKPQE